MSIRALILVPLFALAWTAAPSPTSASPAIRILPKAEIEKRTDYRVQVKLLRRTTSTRGYIRTTTVRVRVLRIQSRSVRVQADKDLRRGTILEFRKSCSTRPPSPRERLMVGYPNGRCGTGWTALPSALKKPRGKRVQLRLRRIKTQGKAASYRTVAHTAPSIGTISGRKIK